jgi:hypothetical protein
MPIKGLKMNDLVAIEKIAQWEKLKALVLDSVSSPITKRVYMPAPTAPSRSVVSAPEALRKLKECREAEKNKLRFEPDSLPRYTDYAH